MNILRAYCTQLGHELEDDRLLVLAGLISHGEFEEAQKVIDAKFRKTVEIDVESLMVITHPILKTCRGMIPLLISKCNIPDIFFGEEEINTCFKAIYAAQRSGKKTVTFHVAAPCRVDTQLSAITFFRSTLLLSLQKDMRFAPWKPELHEFFPWPVQIVAQSLLMLHNRREPNAFNAIPLEIVHQIIQFVSAPPFVWRKRCFACGEHNVEKFFRCSRCHIARYCSRDCQKKHYPRHRVDCIQPESGCERCRLSEALHPFQCHMIDPKTIPHNNVYQTSFNY